MPPGRRPHPKWASSPNAAFRSQLLKQTKDSDRRRLEFALLLSLLVHALLLRLAFDGQGLGLPSISFLWQDRRVAVPDLRVVLSPPPEPIAAPAAAPMVEAPDQAAVARIEPGSPVPPPARSRANVDGPTRVAIAAKPPPAEDDQGAGGSTGASSVEMPARTPPIATGGLPRPIPALPVMSVERAVMDTWVVPTQPDQGQVVAAASSTGEAERARVDAQAPEDIAKSAKPGAPAQETRPDDGQVEAAQQKAAAQEAARQEAARQEAARQEAARQEAARQETVRQETARQEAARQETARQEAARQEAARQEAARQEAARQETARQEAARQETARQEAARQEAARQEAARQEAARQEAARQETARQEAARQEAARQEAARQEAARREAQEFAERREARLREIGRQLDEEAAKRDAATASVRLSSPLPQSLSDARRYRLFGRSDPNAELVLYAESWSQRIERNFMIQVWRETVSQPHADPVVIVAVRSDGSIESVTFERSSGVPAIDEAIRRIIDSAKPYPAFPPVLARNYDVIEIRRSWHFDIAVRLY